MGFVINPGSVTTFYVSFTTLHKSFNTGFDFQNLIFTFICSAFRPPYQTNFIFSHLKNKKHETCQHAD